MDDKELNQEEFLRILMHAYDVGEKSKDITTKELLEDLILHIKMDIRRKRCANCGLHTFRSARSAQILQKSIFNTI